MSRRPRRLLCLAALAIALPALPAQAAESPSHLLLAETNGAPPNTAGPPTGPFEDACGIAIDSHGDRYIADYHHDAIDVYAPSGEYLTQIANESEGNGPCGLAVDSAGNLYVQNWRAEVVRYTPSAYPPSPTTTYAQRALIDPAGTATGLAVDPATGDLYVDDSTYIAKFPAPVSEGEIPTRIGEGAIGEGFGLALSAYPATAGRLYLADAASDAVISFGPSGEALPAIDGAGTPQGGFSYLVDSALAVDPTDGHLFVADNTEHLQSEHPTAVIDEFNSSGDYRGQIARWVTHPASEPGVSIEHHLIDPEPPGLAIDQSGRLYVTSGNDDNTGSAMLDSEGKPVEGSLLYTFGPSGPAKALTLTISGTGQGVVTSSPAGIDCPTACSAEFNEGARVTLIATPDAHSAFRGFSGACAGTATCTLTMSAARAVSAEFEALPQRTLTVGVGGAGQGTLSSQPAGIECSSANVGVCSEQFNEGSTVLLLATAAPHSKLVSWTGECIPAEYPNYPNECAVQMSAAKSIEAEFAPIPPRILTVETSGEGSVRSEPPGIDCGPTCSAPFDEASTLTLTASPGAHRQVAWSGCDREPRADRCEVAMAQARTVQATFTPILHTVTVAVAGEGQLSASAGPIAACGAGGSCSASYPEGTLLTFTPSPAPGSSFVGFSGACAGTAPCTLAIETDTQLSANFAAIPPEPRPAASLRLIAVRLSGSRAALRLGVSGPGALTAAGRGLRPAHLEASAAGELTLHLRLDARARRTLRRRGHLRLALRISLQPADGGAASSLETTVTFRAHHQQRGGHR